MHWGHSSRYLRCRFLRVDIIRRRREASANLLEHSYDLSRNDENLSLKYILRYFLRENGEYSSAF